MVVATATGPAPVSSVVSAEVVALRAKQSQPHKRLCVCARFLLKRRFESGMRVRSNLYILGCDTTALSHARQLEPEWEGTVTTKCIMHEATHLCGQRGLGNTNACVL